MKAILPSSGNVFLKKSFIPAIGERFSLQWKPATLLETFVLLAEIVTASGNQFLNKEPILAGGN